MPSGDEIRDVQRAKWAGLSAGCEKWDSVIMDQLGPVGTAMIERLGIADDQQHLDIAAGTGGPGLTVAKLAPRGHVVLTDLAAEMLDIATRRANAQGITWASGARKRLASRMGHSGVLVPFCLGGCAGPR
jgi:2-polyprenyl-3-methyl-5-hydroxy-6-metoxy-1,4-benzoquinol methylase